MTREFPGHRLFLTRFYDLPFATLRHAFGWQYEWTVTARRRFRVQPRERLAQRVTAAAYGTILVLAALAVIDADSVASGLGWELVTGVGVATWLAHLYAEVIGDHIRHESTLSRSEIARAMIDGSPILVAAVPPAVVLVLGRVDVLDAEAALFIALVVAFLQLVGLGALVGEVVSPRRATTWSYAAVTAAVGLVVVTVKLLLTH
jgi:hypothetical protein